VAVTTDPGVQQMPSVAVDPHDPSRVVVAYLDRALVTTGYAGVGVAVSQDGGGTWQHAALPLPAGFDQGAATPIAHFDDRGRVFVSFAAATFLGSLPPLTDPGGGAPRAMGFRANNGIFVARSNDGGLTWGEPAAVVSHLYDGQNKVPFEIKPDLAIDTFPTLPDGHTPNPNYGSLYEVWSRYYPAGQFPGEALALGGSDILFAVSRDGGQTWQIKTESQPGTGTLVTVIQNYANTGMDAPEGTGHENWSHVTVGPEGDIYVSNFLGGQFGVHHSTDGGTSFVGPRPDANTLFPFGVNSDIVPGSLSNSNFRTQNQRAIAADPLRPGTVYAAEQEEIDDAFGNVLDQSDVIFARSTDYGATWQTTFQVGTQAANVLNDDNGGQRATGRRDDVTSGQVLSRLVTDAQGDVALVWYDTRRDPADRLLDVFGTVSSDGGKTFSPNFRVTDQSFDADLGRFTDAAGKTDYYLGDSLGLALADHTAYAAWTDTRRGNQDVFFGSYPISPPPAAGDDRFEPNEAPATATDLGVIVTRDLSRLAVAPGDEDWFRVRAAATGSLTVTATLAVPGDGVRLELRDAGGAALLATGTAVLDADGHVTGQALTFAGRSGESYLVRVLPGPGASAGAPARYALEVRSLTADLGAQVYARQSGSLAAGAEAIYALSAPAPGSLEVVLTSGAGARGNFHLELLDPNDLTTPLASGRAVGATQLASLAVTGGQAVYVRVFGDAAAQGDYTVTFTNRDQFTTPDNKILFFPTGTGPSEAVLADVNGDGKLDIVVSHVGPDTVSVLLNNGDGTFQAPRDFAVGPFVRGGPSTLSGLPNFRRDLAVADLNGDGFPDIVAVNHDSGDLSILLGRGDGTFAPERRVDATAAPFALAVGDLNHDGIPDLAVVDSTGGPAQGVVLLGRGDGTFRPPLALALPRGEVFRTNTVTIADVNHDGIPDLVERDFVSGTVVLLGNGDGTFGTALPAQLSNGPGLTVADLNGDGIPDLVATFDNNNLIKYSLANGDGTFQPVRESPTGQTPVAIAVADFGSVRADGSLGPPDGHSDLIVADNGLTQPLFSGPPEIQLLPGLVDAAGHFAGLGAPIHLASARGPLDVKAGDLNGDGATDIVVVDSDGVEVIYGKPPVIPPNDTPLTARNLGTVVHVLEPAQTIVPDHADAYYTLTVPTEAARGAGDEVLDFSGLFRAVSGAGLSMEVRDAAGNPLGSGERFRVRVPQGAMLTLHVFGVTGTDGSRGAGAYTLDVDVLPQVVSVEAQALLPGRSGAPGGPTASLVLTLQGDRLDPTSAENVNNYLVIGPNGQAITPTAVNGGQPAVYDAGANVDVASGKTYPTAVRQTVTLLFADPLPAGSYRVELTPALRAAPFNAGESGQLSPAAGFTGHPLVSGAGGTNTEGARRAEPGLVSAGGALGDLTVWQAGTPFLTQFHDDLGALLNARLSARGDDPAIPGAIDRQILDRFDPALGPPAARAFAVVVIWLDPVPIDLFGTGNNRVVFKPQDNSFVNTFSKAFVSVAGNVEVLVLPFVPTGVQTYLLGVDQAPPGARGGAVYFGAAGNEVLELTAALRGGTQQFLLAFGTPAGAPAQAVTSGGQSVIPRAAGGDSILSDLAALVSLSDTRSERPSVTPITPLLGPSQPAVSPGPAATVATRAEVAREIAGGGGAAGGPATDRAPLLKWLLDGLVELGRTFPQLARHFRSWLSALSIRLAAGKPPPADRPAKDEAPVTEPPQDEVPPPSPDEAEAVVVPESPGARPGASLAVLLALVGGSLLRGAGPDVRQKHDGASTNRPRRSDHAD
jgi:hypothetical protein